MPWWVATGPIHILHCPHVAVVSLVLNHKAKKPSLVCARAVGMEQT